MNFPEQIKSSIRRDFTLALFSKFILTLVVVFAFSLKVFALGQVQYVETISTNDSFPIVQINSAADLFVDSNDFSGVIIAAKNLQADIANVTGVSPEFAGENNFSTNVVIIGTIGKSEIIDRLIREKKIDVSAIAGKWESFFLQVVPKPFAGVDNALVICGSDQRGTIFGIYDLSEEIGISPWHFWADVPPKHHDELFVRAGKFSQGPPAVKYRGIFLNDEAPDLSGWAKARFGGYNHEFYTNVFDLLLRLKANYLWPAMWDNCFSEDDPLNPQLANQYGIVMGTSHVEPMMRADKEWNRAGFTQRQWNFETHSNDLKNFWRDGIERNKDYENIVTMAMRGKIDTPVSATANIALLQEIVSAQREIIADVYHTNAANVPQLWALYKEVQEYYERGMRVPDDVTLLWCDDNWGNLRRLPPPEDRQRAGGSGIYYHFDYVGDPRNYKWINSVQIERVWEQMNLALAYGVDRIWIVNVGHLQHVQLPTEFFLSLAWNPDRWPKEKISEFTQLWAEREFGKEFAPQIADIVTRFTKFNARRKPELLSPDTFSLTNYDEADRIVADWNVLVGEAEKIYKKLPMDERAAFFELVVYPVVASANLNSLYVAVAKNHLSASQGRTNADDFAKDAEVSFQTDAFLSSFYNHDLAGGKWNHMMDQTHIGYTSWQQPPANVMPQLAEVENPMNTNSDFKKTVSLDHQKTPPKSATGFIEAEGYVSIEAAHFTKNVAAESARWEEIPNLGRTLSAMSIFPVTAASVQPPENSPHLEYQMYLSDTGKVEVQTILSPTLNFVAGRGLRYALSFDDESPQIVTAVPENYSVGAGGDNRDWKQVVSDNARMVKTNFALSRAGEHTLKIWMVDAGVVLQKIVVDCGGVKPSYLGPPESIYQN